MRDKNTSDRRHYKRIHKHFILTYYNLDDPVKRHEASQLKNISLGGMCLITGEPYSQGTILAIELKTPFEADFIHFEGTVLESRERIKDIIYETRVEFSPLPEKPTFVLNKLIQHFEQEESET